MKTVSMMLFTFLCSAALACPNLSGEYEFLLHPQYNGRVHLKQNGCESIEVRYTSPVYKSDFTYTYKIDGQLYEGQAIRHTDKKFGTDWQTSGPANLDTYSFHKVEFVGDKLSIKQYDGSQKECGLKHVFTYSNCKMFENTFHLVSNSIVKTQIGYASSEKGYSNDEFETRRIK